MHSFTPTGLPWSYFRSHWSLQQHTPTNLANLTVLTQDCFRSESQMLFIDTMSSKKNVNVCFGSDTKNPVNLMTYICFVLYNSRLIFWPKWPTQHRLIWATWDGKTSLRPGCPRTLPVKAREMVRATCPNLRSTWQVWGDKETDAWPKLTWPDLWMNNQGVQKNSLLLSKIKAYVRHVIVFIRFPLVLLDEDWRSLHKSL